MIQIQEPLHKIQENLIIIPSEVKIRGMSPKGHPQNSNFTITFSTVNISNSFGDAKIIKDIMGTLKN